ncbi:hypothetical protein OPV22_019004 [Ensete ventricosum]|uniref:Flavin-containing monooxygenase n=1 Tax=Ensete ventricosum TaxID=4639 RepID=A0AAV8QRP7_ENSVE|nr:hypothetical protein OPV22_019004 [Ensete ventricosum]
MKRSTTGEFTPGNQRDSPILQLKLYGPPMASNLKQVSMVVRDKLHILPRELLGISTFGLSMFLLRWIPVEAADAFLLFWARLTLGDTGKYGIKRPKVGPLELKSTTGKTPVLDIGTLAKIKSGEIKVVPDMKQFTDTGVEFVDGTHEDFDSIVLATGYRSSVTSWLKEEEFFSKKNGFPGTSFPNSWRGNNGLSSYNFELLALSLRLLKHLIGYSAGFFE